MSAERETHRALTAPEWTFDTDGDTEGWNPANDLDDLAVSAGSVTMTSSGDDPYLESPGVRIPGSGYTTMVIEMRIDADADGSAGQVFFVTEDHPAWAETNSLVFDVATDGDTHTYELDMADASAWNSIVTQLRFDPVSHPEATIEIDSISFR